MKKFRKALAVVMCVVMTLTAAPLSGFVGMELPDSSGFKKIVESISAAFDSFSTKAQAATYSGTCGDNLTWTLDTSTGVLNITGTGAMTNCDSPASVPWYSYLSDIKTVNIASGVTTIGYWAFFYCTSLTSVTIPDSVTTIGNSAFAHCTSLTSVTIGNSVTTIGDAAFRYCTSLTSVTIPNSVTTIGSGAFYDCDSLTSVTIPDSVTTIGDEAFAYCTSLTSVTIPESVTSIGAYAFNGCAILTIITVAENNKHYSSDSYGVLFNKDKTTLIQYPIGNTRTSYDIPDSVTTIGSSAFRYCTILTSVTIPDSVTTIGSHAFYNCDSLTSVTIPDSVTSIGYSAFEYCTSLTSVKIGNSITTIDGFVFYNCDSLTSVTIPDSVKTIVYHAFNRCYSLTDVYYSGSEEQWKAISIGEYNEPLLNATIHYNYVPESGSSITGVEISGDLPVKSGNTLTFNVTTSTGITKLRMEDSGYIVNEWTNIDYAVHNGDGTLTWIVTQIINTIGENRTLDFRAGTADGYEEGVYKSPAFTCIENEQKLPSTTIEHPAMSAIFLQGDEQNLIWTVDGVPGDGVMPDYFIINVFKDNELVFAKRNITAQDYLGDDGKFFYNIDGGYFEETGEYEISVTSVKEGYQYSDDEVVVGIYPPDLYIEGFNSGTEFVNFGEKLYLEGCIKGVSEHIRVFVQTPSMGASHEYFTQDKTTQQFDLSALYPIEFGTGAYDAPGEYYISVYATALGKSEETLLAKKKIVLLAKDVKQLDKPTITSSVVTKTGESYTLTWNSVKNADYYTVIISELGITRTGIETESFVIPQDTFKSAGEYTVLVYAHTYSDNYLTSNNSIKLTVQKSEISCSVLSARIIGSNTIKAGNYLNFEIVTTKDTTKLRLMDKNYVVTEWTDSSNYTDKDGKRYWNVKEIIKTVGVNRKLQFVAGNAEGYSDISAEVTFTCNENPNKLGNITITSPLEGYSYDQNTLQYLVWNIEGEISPDYYIVEIFTNSGSKKYINKNVDGNLLWIEIPAEYFENTGTYTISITAVKEHYQTSSSSVTFVSRCTHMHTETTTPTLIKGSYKSSGDSQHTYQTQTVETCINCKTVVNKIVESHTENHYMHEGLLCVCGYYKAQNGFLTLNGLHLQSKNTEYTYLSPTNTLDYWGSVSPSDSGYISMLGKVTRNGVEYAFIRYPLNSGGYKCGFIRAELVSKIPYGQPTATVNREKVNIIYDANGYVYADAEQLFEVLGGKAYWEDYYAPNGTFQSGVTFLHNSYKTTPNSYGYYRSYFESNGALKWEKLGSKYVVKNGEYYDILYSLNTSDKKILGGNKKLYTANNRVYFPLSVLTSDICMYNETSTNEFVYKGFNSDSLEVSTPQLIVDDVIVLKTQSNNKLVIDYTPTEGVATKLGTDIICEVSGFDCKITYYNDKNEITVFPTSDGFGKIDICINVNGVKTVVWQKKVHSIDKQYINITVANLYKKHNLQPGLVVDDIEIQKTANGHNVSFNAYNNHLGAYLFQVHDSNGNVCDYKNGSNLQVGFGFANGLIINGGILAGVEQGFDATWELISQSDKAKLENSGKFTKTHISLWVPAGGYITVKDASTSKAALTYDIFSLYGIKSSAFMDYIDGILGLASNRYDDVLPKKLRPIDFLNNFIVETELSTIAKNFSDLITNGNTDIYETYLQTLIEKGFIKLLESASQWVSIIDTISKLAVSWGNVKLLTMSINEDLAKFKSVDKEFGFTTLYFGEIEQQNSSISLMLNANSNNDITLITSNSLSTRTPSNLLVSNGYFSKEFNGKFGLCNINGDFVISPEWNYVSGYSCGIVSAVDDSGVKFLDITGKILFTTNHNFAGVFSYDRCIVIDDMLRVGVIDIQGKQIVPCEYDYAWILFDGYIIALKNNIYTIIDPSGKLICSFEQKVAYVSDDNKILVIVDEQGQIGAIGYNGETIAKNKFDCTGGVNGNAVAVKKDGTYTVFDLNGKKLFEITADYIGEFSEGVATVIDENGVRLVDMSGNTVVNMSDDVADVYPFKENLAIVYYSDGSYAYMNNQYQIVSDRYSFASDFNDGYAVVSVNENGTEKWAMVNKAFETIHTFDDELEFKQNDFNSGYVFGTSETGATRYTTVGDKGTQKEVLSFEKSQIDLRVEESKQLKTVSQNTSSSLTWISSNPAVAKVDSSGTVIALAVGETTVTVSNGAGVTSSCVIKVLPNNYKVTWIVDGKKTDQVIKFGEKITQPSNPEKVGYTFIGWTPSVPSKMPANDLTFTAQFELLVKELKVKNPSTNTVKYGDTLILHADFGETVLPEGYSILWTVEGAGFNMTPAADGLTCNMTSVANGNATVKATLVDENGEAVLDAEGNEMSDTKELKSNASFWQKIVSFFKNLFRVNRIISE